MLAEEHTYRRCQRLRGSVTAGRIDAEERLPGKQMEDHQDETNIYFD
jgi:hypothetical protein